MSRADAETRFERREWKYLVPLGRVDELVPRLLQYMTFDPHSDRGGYYVQSLYLDDADLTAFHEKLDGVQYRKKFRVRSYSTITDLQQPAFLEIKEKRNDVILKRRIQVPANIVETANYSSSEHLTDPVMQEWRYHVYRQGLRPKMLISYDRLAFVPLSMADYRVTIDTNVRYRPSLSLAENGETKRLASISQESAVLEIKFGTHVPRFVVSLVQHFNLSNDAVSKYCDSIITHYKLT